MKQNLPVSLEFIYQVFALIVIVILVHAAYVAIIRPNADAVLAAQAAALEIDEPPSSDQSLFVMVKDYEQEACFVLMFWALAIMGYKSVTTIRQQGLLNLDLIPLAEGVRILPEDTLEFSRRIQALPPAQRESLLPRTLLAWPEKAFESESADAVMKELFGSTDAAASDAVTLTAPDIAENGAVISSESHGSNNRNFCGNVLYSFYSLQNFIQVRNGFYDNGINTGLNKICCLFFENLAGIMLLNFAEWSNAAAKRTNIAKNKNLFE